MNRLILKNIKALTYPNGEYKENSISLVAGGYEVRLTSKLKAGDKVFISFDLNEATNRVRGVARGNILFISDKNMLNACRRINIYLRDERKKIVNSRLR